MKRRCPGCGSYKTASEFYDSSGGACKECRKERSRVRYAPIKASVREARRRTYRQGKKKCRSCKQWKRPNEYSKKPSNWDGLNHFCKGCIRIQSRERYWRDREKELKRGRDRYKKDPQKKAEMDRHWRQANPEKSRAIWHRYKARKKNASGSFTGEELALVFDHYCPDGLCLGCGEMRPLQADHVVPLAKGGTNFIANIQPLCKKCNAQKGDEIVVDYRPDAGRYCMAIMGES